jgi:DNA-binding LacI/PurR family transcriptional regulator
MSRPRAQRSTLYDVAQLANVSYQTVSRVVNGHVSVSDSTRSRVLQVIRELNYQPNFLAKGLSTNRSHLLGLIISSTEHYGPAQVALSVERHARAHGYEVLLSSRTAGQTGEMTAAIQRMGQFGVDGLILLAPCDAQEVTTSVPCSSPFVMINAANGLTCTTVNIDHVAGGTLATEHLIHLGHRRILHVGGPSGWNEAQQRYQGYTQALRTHGLTEWLRLEGDWSATSGYHAVRLALENHFDFTAVFAGNDQMALGAVAALREAGLTVPRDVSVVGFDDTPETAFFMPGITSVRQDLALLGRASVDELMRLMNAPGSAPRHVMFKPHLIERASTSRAAT